VLLVLERAHVLIQLEKDLLRHVLGQPRIADERVGGAENGAVVQRKRLVKARRAGRSRLNPLCHRVNQSLCHSFTHPATLNT
jgi:hypothetical protein